MVSSFVKSATMAVTMLASTAEAHNTMTQPPPHWPPSVTSKNNPSGHIDPEVLPRPEGMTYTTEVGVYMDVFWTAFNASTYKSLKEFLLEAQTLEKGASAECGFSVVDAPPQDLPDMIQWDFFTSGHQGPFVATCDDTLVAQSWNAAIEYPGNPANVPYDKASCAGASVLTSYWLALHAIPWQVYTNCAPLTGGKPSTKSTSSNPASSPSNTPATPPTAAAPPPTEAPPETPPETPAPTVKSEYSNPASSPSDTPATPPAAPLTTPTAAPPPIETPPKTPALTFKSESSYPASSPSDTPATPPAPSPPETPVVATPTAEEEPQTEVPTEGGDDEQGEQEKEQEKEEPTSTDKANPDSDDNKTEAPVKPSSNDKCGVRRRHVMLTSTTQ